MIGYLIFYTTIIFYQFVNNFLGLLLSEIHVFDIFDKGNFFRYLI